MAAGAARVTSQGGLAVPRHHWLVVGTDWGASDRLKFGAFGALAPSAHLARKMGAGLKAASQVTTAGAWQPSAPHGGTWPDPVRKRRIEAEMKKGTEQDEDARGGDGLQHTAHLLWRQLRRAAMVLLLRWA